MAHSMLGHDVLVLIRLDGSHMRHFMSKSLKERSLHSTKQSWKLHVETGIDTVHCGHDAHSNNSIGSGVLADCSAILLRQLVDLRAHPAETSVSISQLALVRDST